MRVSVVHLATFRVAGLIIDACGELNPSTRSKVLVAASGQEQMPITNSNSKRRPPPRVRPRATWSARPRAGASGCRCRSGTRYPVRFYPDRRASIRRMLDACEGQAEEALVG